MILSRMSQVLEKFSYEKKELSQESVGSHFVFGNEEKYIIDVASDFKTKVEAYQLMYRLYSSPEMNYAIEDITEMWYSLFNLDPNAITLVVKNLKTKKVVATLTVVLDSVFGLPLEENYPVKMADFRNDNRLCAEIISLGFDEEVRGSSEVLIQLFKFAYLVCNGVHFATDLLIMIKPSHAKYYERKLAFKPIGKEVNCKKINNQPVVLFHLDLLIAQEKAENIVLPKEKLKCDNIYKAFVDAKKNKNLMHCLNKKIENAEFTCQELEYFFMVQKKILVKIDAEKLARLSRMYNNEGAKQYLKRLARKNNFELLLA